MTLEGTIVAEETESVERIYRETTTCEISEDSGLSSSEQSPTPLPESPFETNFETKDDEEFHFALAFEKDFKNGLYGPSSLISTTFNRLQLRHLSSAYGLIEVLGSFAALVSEPLPARYIVGDTADFWISLPGTEDGPPLFPSLFSLSASSPSGEVTEPQILHSSSLLISLCLKGRECGNYVVSVQVGKIHIPGSPFSIPFSPDYGTRRLVSGIDTEIAPNGLFEPKKGWGITSNTRTDSVLVTDREKNCVTEYSCDGLIIRSWGSPGHLGPQFSRPTGIAYDYLYDRLFIVDKDNHRICVYTSSGSFLFSFGGRGKRSGQFFYPWAIAISNDCTLLGVSDSRNGRVQLFTSNGLYLKEFGEFSYPRGIAFSPNADVLYVSDFKMHVILRIDIETSVISEFVATGLCRPSGLAVDVVGNLLVADMRSHSLKVYTSDGDLAHSISYVPRTLSIELPTDVTIMRGNYIALSDYNGRISIF